MRFCRILLVVSALIMFTSQSFADNRVVLEKLKNIATVVFKSDGDRLDPDFRLSFGDTVTLDLSGKIEASHKLVIGRDGKIIIPLIGRVSVADMNIGEAREAVKKEIDKKYGNVESDLNIVDVRNIQIEVMGYVKAPGLYKVSPFCRIAEAVVKSGGPNNDGSLIGIRLIRDGKEVVTFNAYDFINKGDNSKNAQLKHGDVIFMPVIKNTMRMTGDVAYPGIYELEKGSKLSESISTAGGALPTKVKRKVYVLRINSNTQIAEAIKEIAFESNDGIDEKDDLILENKDVIYVTNIFDCTAYDQERWKMVRITGEVNIPGEYVVKENETLGALLKRTGGFKNTAFVQGAVFTRATVKGAQKSILDKLIKTQKIAILEEDARLAGAIITPQEKELRQRSIEYKRKALDLVAANEPEGRIIIDVEDIAKGKSDLTLNANDTLYIPPLPDWVVVTGSVYYPQAVKFIEDRALEYYLSSVGGPNKFSDKDDIYIIKANGQCKSKGTGYGMISRGDIIVVPEKQGEN